MGGSMKAKLCALKTLIVSVGGRRRKFISEEVDGQPGKQVVYEFTDAEWEGVKDQVDHKGRPLFVEVTDSGPIDKEVPIPKQVTRKRHTHF
jgi:hypothetical protein